MNPPRQDFVELARALDARVLSFSDVRRGSWFTRLLPSHVGRAVALAWLAFRKRGSFYFVTAENTAIPLALLLKFRRGVTLALIGHRITTPLKGRIIRVFHLFHRIGAILCYSRQQERFALESLGIPVERVRRIAFQVDEKFFHPCGSARTGAGGGQRGPGTSRLLHTFSGHGKHRDTGDGRCFQPMVQARRPDPGDENSRERGDAQGVEQPGASGTLPQGRRGGRAAAERGLAGRGDGAPRGAVLRTPRGDFGVGRNP